VDVAVAARDLVLYPEREPDPCDSFFHAPIVFIQRRLPQDLTKSGFSGSGDNEHGTAARAAVRTTG
jgi:hypothetical protein